MSYITALFKFPATRQRVRNSRAAAIVELALLDLKVRAVPLSHAADISIYNILKKS